MNNLALTSSSFHGEIDETGFADDLQAIISVSPEGCLKLSSVHGQGLIHFQNGTILTALTNHNKGIAALQEILLWQTGSFQLDRSLMPIPSIGQIRLSVTQALLVASQSVGVIADEIAKNTA